MAISHKRQDLKNKLKMLKKISVYRIFQKLTLNNSSNAIYNIFIFKYIGNHFPIGTEKMGLAEKDWRHGPKLKN